MATTSPDNIKTPDAGDQYALVQDLGAMADTVQGALNRRANSYVGTSAERAAFTSAPEGATWRDTNSPYRTYERRGSSWVGAKPLNGVVAVAGGADENRTQVVNFPSGYFSSTPTFALSAQTTSPSNVLGLSFTAPSKDQVTVVLRYATATTIQVNWTAFPA